jgi:8-oxo-dGTP pyrophosphatase MutT (NUDIX family)
MLRQKVDIKDQLLRGLTVSVSGSSDFDLNKDHQNITHRSLRKAAVLVAVQMIEDTPHIILTKRAAALKHYPGQVAFPGGKVDAEDADAISTALREAEEEIGLPPSQVEVLGCLAPHVTITDFRITPVIGLVEGPISLLAEQSEVDEIFVVPLSFLTDPDNYYIRARSYFGKPRKYYTVPFGPYYIWGATARMLRGLAERLQP